MPCGCGFPRLTWESHAPKLLCPFFSPASWLFALIPMKAGDSQHRACLFNFSLQLFNEVTEAEVTLRNSGKVGFTYVVLSPSMAAAASPLPGVPLLMPSTVSMKVAQVIH